MSQQPRPGIWQIAIIALIAIGYTAPSYAYIDPGTGSIILQSVLAGIAVAAGFARLYWHKFKRFLSSLTGTVRETGSPDEPNYSHESRSDNQQ
jgi:hypothetical protein